MAAQLLLMYNLFIIDRQGLRNTCVRESCSRLRHTSSSLWQACSSIRQQTFGSKACVSPARGVRRKQV